jgi:hypothetical protein
LPIFHVQKNQSCQAVSTWGAQDVIPRLAWSASILESANCIMLCLNVSSQLCQSIQGSQLPTLAEPGYVPS